MSAYAVDGWHDFFVMIGGASAALAGLVFVAVSINQEQILKTAALTSMAARSLIALFSVVVVAAVALVPQPLLALGIEYLVVAVALVATQTTTTVRTFDAGDILLWKASRLSLAWLSSVPLLGAGISLTAHGGGGLFWVLAECLAALAVGLYTAWILLIEIRR